MKTKEEIEQLALLKYPKHSSDPYNPDQDDNYYERLIWIEGYTQCQEDMAVTSKIIWENACKAQMELVYEHCTYSPQGTNGHAIKHWVKQAEFKQD